MNAYPICMTDIPLMISVYSDAVSTVLGGAHARCRRARGELLQIGNWSDVSDGSNASVELSWHVGFTPDFGRMVATQRADASGHERTLRLK